MRSITTTLVPAAPLGAATLASHIGATVPAVGAKAECASCGKTITLRPLGTRWDANGCAPAFSWLTRQTGSRHPVHCDASTERYTPYHRPAGMAATYTAQVVTVTVAA